MDERRRSPENILDSIERGDAALGRGELRVFLGMCPGVGKTYAMLKSAKEQLLRGSKVLIGVVETHGRKDTEELVAGLEFLPKIELEYKTAKLLEMDLDRILALKPQLVLVDELAHTNAPGSRHHKRYQDVEELLARGINVYTTLNIQHIESRNDQVAQITGVQVRETVPDSMLASAKQIELVDLSPAELLTRLQEGKVYLGDRAQAAVQGFFKEEQLLALRELALRFTAEKVDQDLTDQMVMKGIEGPWNTNERLLVAVSHSPYSPRLIRATRRMAYTLEAPWIAVYVDTGIALDSEDQERLQKNMGLARELGAEVQTIADNDVARAIQSLCREKNVTQIIMGRPDRRFIKDILSRGTLLDQLVRTTSKIDVHVIRAERKPRFRGFHLRLPDLGSGFFAYYHTAWFIFALSIFNLALLPYVGYRALGSVFLLAILIVSSLASRGPILFAAVLSAVIWDYAFIPPQWTFVIRAFEDVMMVSSFFITALVGGLLTSRIRRQEKTLQIREERTRLLYELVRSLASATSLKEIEAVVLATINPLLLGKCALFLKTMGGPAPRSASFALSENDLAVVRWTLDNGRPAGWSTQTLSAASCLCLPMRGTRETIGVLAFVPAQDRKDFPLEKESFLQTVLAQATIAIERFSFQEEAQSAKLLEISEKLHQTLLNSVSHELRTPITALIGTSTALKDEKTLLDSHARNALTDELVRSARRLDRVVENLLDLSRLEKGGLALKREWFDLRELFTSAIAEFKSDFNGREITLTRDDSVLFEGDFILLLHAFSQLLLNALKYSQTKVEVEILRLSGRAEIRVYDRGVGLTAGLETKVFEKFFRQPGTPAGGLGLGLTITGSIVELHQGAVAAENRTDRQGAVFTISLPLKAAPKELEEALK